MEKNLIELKKMLIEILNHQPSNEELDYDEDKIEMYAEMRNLLEAMNHIN